MNLQNYRPGGRRNAGGLKASQKVLNGNSDSRRHQMARSRLGPDRTRRFYAEVEVFSIRLRMKDPSCVGE